MHSPKALLFDFGGTLDSHGQTWLERFRPLYARAGLAPELSEGPVFDRAFYDADDNLHLKHRLEGLDLAQVVLLQVQDTLAGLKADPALAPRVAEPFTADSRRHLAAAADWLGGLKGTYKLAIVSNFYGNMRSMLKAEGLAPLFDSVADSIEVGVTKPEPGIFLAALKPLGLAPQDALMVGDSLHRDMAGAERLGMPHAFLAGTRDCAPCCGKASVLRRLQDLDRFLAAPLAQSGA